MAGNNDVSLVSLITKILIFGMLLKLIALENVPEMLKY